MANESPPADSDAARKAGDLRNTTQLAAFRSNISTIADSVSTIPSEFNMTISGALADPYNEDQAELQFLLSKPTCFIVLGKPGSGKTTLAKRLAQEWKCELVNATDVINQAIELQTEMGNKAQEILLRGEAIPENVAAQMIEDKINSTEVGHHGYVLDGFPSLSEDYMSIKDQLELVKNWKLNPDFIINIRIPDKDLEVRRIGQKIDPLTGTLYTKEMYDPEKQAHHAESEHGEEEDEEEADEEEDDVTRAISDDIHDVPVEVIERLINRPEDLPVHVSDHIKRYKSNMLRMLEEYIVDHDQQHLIELDGNKSSGHLFKDLLTRLSCFVLRPAAIVMRLQDQEEDEIPEEMETDELMRTLAPKEMVAPRYRWRRSRWLRYCPVALAEGNLVQGKPEFAVSFLDKMYVLSSADALTQFMKNPRPFLLPPMPRPPCKLVITGPPMSGKTHLAHKLAARYGAKVLDMEELIKPKLEEEIQKVVDSTREFAVENAIATVKSKLKEEIDKAPSIVPTQDGTVAGVDLEPDAGKSVLGTPTKPDLTPPGDGSVIATDSLTNVDENKDEAPKSSELTSKTESGASESVVESAQEQVTSEIKSTKGKHTVSIADEVEKPRDLTSEIGSDHPEVQLLVADSMKSLDIESITLSPDIYIDVMYAAIAASEKEMRNHNPSGPLNGGWIFDNFPRLRHHWFALIEKATFPDDVIYLKDESENGDFLVRRWYQTNRSEVNALIGARLTLEEEVQRRKEEEENERMEKDTKERLEKEQAAAAKLEEEERQSLIEETEEPEVEEDTEQTENVEAPKEDDEPAADEDIPPPFELPKKQSGEGVPEAVETEDGTDLSLATPDDMPPEGPELNEFRQLRRNYESEWNASQTALMSSSPIEPIQINIQKQEDDKLVQRSEEELLRDITSRLEHHIAYQCWELQGMDIDEEEEDNEAVSYDNEEEEEGEEEDPNRSSKKQLGDTSHFCPVALKETGILFPGNPENAAKYRERTYYLSTPEARDSFLAKPLFYLPKYTPFTPPPVRLLMLGPTGSGKTMHGKKLAQQLGLFHIQFRERLQELIIAKTKKKIGKAFEEEQQEDIPDFVEEEEEPAEEEQKPVAVPAVSTLGGSGTDSSGEQDKPEKPVPEPVADEEKLEEEEMDLTEDEEAIKAYLEADEPLPNELLEKIISPWWNSKPFRETGFILEGFPHTVEEATLMGELGLYPDSAFCLAVEDTDVIKRLLPPKLVRWKERRAKLLVRKGAIKASKLKKRTKAIEKKRAELKKEKEAVRLEKKQAQEAERDSEEDEEEENTEDEEDSDDDEEEIEAELAEMFEDEEEEEEEEMETLDDAKDRLRNDLEEVFDNDTNQLAQVQDKLEELMIPRVDIDGSRKPHIVRYQLDKKLKPYVQSRHSMFERATAVSERVAMRMLQTGYKQPSRFGKWCPIKMLEGDCIQPMHGIEWPTYPAIYRHHVYFLSTIAAREEFLADPRTYLCLPTPKPVVPISMAIIGPPKSGKTTLANRFASEYGMIRISIGEAMRIVMDLQPKTDLVKSVISHLRQGLPITDELSVKALAIALLDMRCHTRGYILDGFPLTRKQVDLMTLHNLIPVRVLELQLDHQEIRDRARKDRLSPLRQYPMNDSPQMLVAKMEAWYQEIGKVREWYKEEHANWILVDAKHSQWWMWNHVSDIAQKSIRQIQTYLQRIGVGKAASIANMCIRPFKFKERLREFGQYCPVSLAERGELVDCSVTVSLQFAAEYRGYYFKMAGQEELDKFLSSPECYIPPLAPTKLPPQDMLPKRCTSARAKALFPMPVHLQGYCPVTYLDGQCQYEAIIPGNSEIVVEYREYLYYMADEEKADKFMRLPAKYWNLRLPHKLPPKKNPLDIYNLPMLGYLEQSVAETIIKSLTAVGNVKPKYPFLTSTRSALVYVAFHLKAYNPRSSAYIRKKYTRKLRQFEETCELIKYLGCNMTQRYKEPADRPIDFDNKMEKFIALKNVEPTTSYVA